MTSSSPPQGGAIIFAVDQPTCIVAHELIRLADDRAKVAMCNTGEALRVVIRQQPDVVFVCAALPRLEQSAAMIDALHRRRPGLPLLAVAGEHHPSVERTVRSAGASSYFALDSESERRLLLATLESLGHLLPVPSNHPPPRARGAPPASVTQH